MQHVTSHSHDTPQQQSFRLQPHANASSNRPMAEMLFGLESIKEQMTNILREQLGQRSKVNHVVIKNHTLIIMTQFHIHEGLRSLILLSSTGKMVELK